jgi:class 3 adenylate cyclase
MVGFTKMSSTMTATELVALLGDIVNRFDELCIFHEIEKIKTIGDAYFAVGGLHNSHKDHPEKIIRFGLDMIKSLDKYNGKIEIRVGVHTGPIVAGVIGRSKFAYDVWGNTVNIASRMESNGIPGRVQCTRATYERAYDCFLFEERKNVFVKGQGEMTCYLVTAEKEEGRRRRSPLEQHEEAFSILTENGTGGEQSNRRNPVVLSLTEDALKMHSKMINSQ